VYPDESAKPPVDEGMNQPAQITLERCWPLDRATRQPIRDPMHKRYRQHVARLQRMPDTEFVEYVGDSGTWIFRVQHFSKYGLVDDDEEGNEEEREEEDGEMADVHDHSDDVVDLELSEAASSLVDGMESVSEAEAEESTVDSAERGSSIDGGADTAQLSVVTEPRKVHAMQASLFRSSERLAKVFVFGDVQELTRGGGHPPKSPAAAARVGMSTGKRPYVESPGTHLLPHFGDSNVGMVTAAPPPSIMAHKALPDAKHTPVDCKVPYEQSITYGKAGVLLDAGLAMGRSFRVGFGPRGDLAYPGAVATTE